MVGKKNILAARAQGLAGGGGRLGKVMLREECLPRGHKKGPTLPTESPLRHPLLCIDPFAGRADEHELFPTHSKF